MVGEAGWHLWPNRPLMALPQQPCPWNPDWRPPTAGDVKASEDALAAMYEQDKAERRAKLGVEDPELVRDGQL